MESQKPKIAMYVKRPFGDKMNASFDFIKENWKPLLKLTTYLILPLCLLQALSLNGFMGGLLGITMAQQMGTNPVESLGGMFFFNYGAYFLLYLIGSILLSSLVYALIKTYNDREEGLQNVTLRELKPLLFKNIKRLLILTLIGIGLMIVISIIVVALGMLSYFTLILTVPLIIAFCIPLLLLAPIYLFEKVTVIEALEKTFRLGFATWGGVFLISLVMGILASILQSITMMPWYIATLVKVFFGMSDTGSEATVSVGYSFMIYLLAIIQAFGAYLSMIFSLIGMAYQYGHASEVVDSVSVEDDIDNFDKL